LGRHARTGFNDTNAGWSYKYSMACIESTK